VEVCALSALCALRVPGSWVEVCALSALRDLRVPGGWVEVCALYPLIPDHLVRLLGGTEKAGGGGSIPSLATTF
jgi:hypothetical protein